MQILGLGQMFRQLQQSGWQRVRLELDYRGPCVEEAGRRPALSGPLSSLTLLLRALELRGSSLFSLTSLFQHDDNTLGLLFGELVMKGIASCWGTPSACETKANAASIFL